MVFQFIFHTYQSSIVLVYMYVWYTITCTLHGGEGGGGYVSLVFPPPVPPPMLWGVHLWNCIPGHQWSFPCICSWQKPVLPLLPSSRLPRCLHTVRVCVCACMHACVCICVHVWACVCMCQHDILHLNTVAQQNKVLPNQKCTKSIFYSNPSPVCLILIPRLPPNRQSWAGAWDSNLILV